MCVWAFFSSLGALINELNESQEKKKNRIVIKADYDFKLIKLLKTFWVVSIKTQHFEEHLRLPKTAEAIKGVQQNVEGVE